MIFKMALSMTLYLRWQKKVGVKKSGGATIRIIKNENGNAQLLTGNRVLVN